MKIYIDFDGTLFDTDRYTADFMCIFNEYGVDNVAFEEARHSLFNNDNLFNLNMMIDYFIEKNIVTREIKNKIEDLLNNSYLYPEVIHCLNELINSGYELYLLTYGDLEFQKMKINAAGISKYFKDIIITDKDKSALNLDYKNSIFIDNNPYVIETLYGVMSKTIVRIKRDCERYSQEKCNGFGIIECRDFNQIVSYLKGGVYDE